MRSHLLLAAPLIGAVLATSGETLAQTKRLRASFGVTQYLPLRTPRTKASDYVPDAERAVPAAVIRCGGKATTYITGTDGAAAVDFSTRRSLSEIRACMVKALPEVTIETAQPY